MEQNLTLISSVSQPGGTLCEDFSKPNHLNHQKHHLKWKLPNWIPIEKTEAQSQNWRKIGTNIMNAFYILLRDPQVKVTRRVIRKGVRKNYAHSYQGTVRFLYPLDVGLWRCLHPLLVSKPHSAWESLCCRISHDEAPLFLALSAEISFPPRFNLRHMNARRWAEITTAYASGKLYATALCAAFRYNINAR